MLCALLVWPIRDTRIIIYMAFWIVIRNESCAFGCYSKHSCCLGPLISEFSFSYSVLSCDNFLFGQPVRLAQAQSLPFV